MNVPDQHLERMELYCGCHLLHLSGAGGRTGKHAAVRICAAAGRRPGDYLFVNRLKESLHLSTRQYSWIVQSWIESAGLDSSAYGTAGGRQRWD